MKLYDIVQWLIILGAVLFSALYVLGRVAPQWRARLARHLQQQRYAHWVNQLGVRLARSAGCGACDACGSCAPGTTGKKSST